MTGVFIKRGMNIGIPAGGFTFSVGDDGKVSSSLTLHVHFDVCPTWINISLGHLAAARDARSARETAWAGADEEAKSDALEREFEASMQAIMAAAIAIDAFYAVLQPHISVPPSMLAKWRGGGTARYSQVTEIIRRAFKLQKNGTLTLRNNLKEIYRYRDMAVHPSSKLQEAVYHPELKVGVEWRFAYYRASNAEIAVNAVSGMLWDLCHNGKPADDKISKCIATLKSRMEEIFPDGNPAVPKSTASN